jgi:MFS transporter, NNP family, nitrate/nitrite transporter
VGELHRVTPSQQHRVLGMSTLAFTVCFAVWTIFSIIGVQIEQDLGLNDTEFGLLVATPILTGSLSRILLGIWTDQYGGRLVYTLLMVAAAASWLLSTVETHGMFLVAVLGVGLAGGSSPSASPMSRAGTPRSGRVRRSACSAAATWARR